MNKARAFELARALESGNFRQIEGTLRRQLFRGPGQKVKYGYCCLGVAEMSRGKCKWEFKEGAMGFVPMTPGAFSSTGVSPETHRYYDFYDESGTVRPGSEMLKFPNGQEYWSLMGANDDSQSFRDIAQVIRERYKDL